MRAQPVSVQELFGNVQKNYFRIYRNYLYFNIARYAYDLNHPIFVNSGIAAQE